MRHISQAGIDLIQRFEGYSSTVYICPAGHPTIGYGHVVLDHEDFSQGLTKSEAENLLRRDVSIAEKAVLRFISVPLTEGQFDALVSFTFNLGSGALQRSTLRRVVNRNHHYDVPRQLKRWVYAKGKKLNGLVNRRYAEIICYNRNNVGIITVKYS